MSKAPEDKFSQRPIVAEMGRRSKWHRLSLTARRRDSDRCQICGDVAPIQYSPYGSLHAHHIAPRSEGGPDSLDNVISLCDLCHAVLHPHLWPSWFPQVVNADEGARRAALGELHEIRESFGWLCRLPQEERMRVQGQVWTMFGLR